MLMFEVIAVPVVPTVKDAVKESQSR